MGYLFVHIRYVSDEVAAWMKAEVYARNEEHVQQAVEDGHVYRDEEDDEFGEEELEGPEDEDFEFVLQWPSIDFLFGYICVVAGLFAQTAGTFQEDGGCVCLGDSDCHHDVDEASHDELDPVEPSPAFVVRDEAANERT